MLESSVAYRIAEQVKCYMRPRTDMELGERSRVRRLSADLTGASLERASLRQANLPEAVLDDANLKDSDLRGANLRRASLFRTDLSRADLGGSNLGMADLRFACLERANLNRANLHQANLLGAKLAEACLDHADLAGAILPDGTRFTDDADLERFTDEDNAAFRETLKAIAATDCKSSAAGERETVKGAAGRDWAQFVDRT